LADAPCCSHGWAGVMHTSACTLTGRRDASQALPDGWAIPEKQPLRVVLDSRGRLLSGPLLDTSLAPTLIFTSKHAPREARERWRAAGVEVYETAVSAASGDGKQLGAGEDGVSVDLDEVLLELGRRGVLQLMVEGGGSLLGSFLQTRSAQQLRLYIGSCALGSSARRWIQAPLAETIEEAQRWELLGVERVGNDVCLDYQLPYSSLGGDPL
jgi:diaminohydroxyphosphoribosylaminopyrimidine deaminase / 5-amino-6-(5-phosphoribosylamino)uracil reductase